MPLAMILALSPGCPLQAPSATSLATGGAASTSGTTTAAAPSTVLQGGPRAIRIIFKQTYPSGSFDASPGGGTPATPGSGQAATRYFNPDGSILAGGGPGASTWLSGFEIGISGGNNSAAKHPSCAKFADTSESSSSSNCLFGPSGSTAPVGCGAPNGLYRVSEYDCLRSSSQVTADGNGGPGDGVYLRATFNRALLGTGENLMASIEYVASSFDPAPSDPRQCFTNGIPTPEKCSNVTWKAYIKHSVGELVQPFLMLIPPMQSYVNTGIGTSGANPQMKQFIIPLAGDPQLSVLQISRIRSTLNTSNTSPATTACNNGGSAQANSPLCAGLILYSLTLYRI